MHRHERAEQKVERYRLHDILAQLAAPDARVCCAFGSRRYARVAAVAVSLDAYLRLSVHLLHDWLPVRQRPAFGHSAGFR